MTDESIRRILGETDTMTQVNPDEYNGWTNRETWAAALHIDNDYGTYTMRNEWVEEAREDEAPVWHLADRLQNWLEELAQDVVDGEPTSEGVRMMLREIGSLWRVDYREIAQGWLSE